MNVFVKDKRFTLKPSRSIGKGGEADVFDLDGALALKLFKPPTHPDFAGDKALQEMATRRLAEQQAKLSDFPTHLPETVIAPLELARDSLAGRVVGYTMRLLRGAELLMS